MSSTLTITCPKCKVTFDEEEAFNPIIENLIYKKLKKNYEFPSSNIRTDFGVR